MKKAITYIFALSFLALSCIENDLSYPRIVAAFTDFQVEGGKSVNINSETRTVEIVLQEDTDITAVKVLSYALSNEPSVTPEIPEVLDLSSPVKFVLKTYQEYEWTVSAVQPIERYVKCRNQIGEAEFNLDTRTVFVYVAADQDRKKISIEDMKLEAEGSRIVRTKGFVSKDGQSVEKEEECLFPMTLDCVVSRYFYVSYKGNEIEWTMTVLNKEVELEITRADGWCHHAEIEANTNGKGTPVIEYRKAGANIWEKVSDVKAVNGKIAVEIPSLNAGTDYEVKISNGIAESPVVTFRTELPETLDNLDFEAWHQASPNNTWYPRAKDAVSYDFDTPNKGVNIMGEVNLSRPEFDFTSSSESKTAVRLESGVAIGMFAAGSIFTGQFKKVSLSGGAGAELTWGTPFESRPYSMKGYFSYEPKIVDKARAPYEGDLGKMDKCQLLVMLTDWEEPFLVVTSNETFVDQKNDPHIIAHGTIEYGESTQGKYQEFECVLDYRDRTRKPKYIVVIACSSVHGDYFTGGVGSVLYVDDFSFVYR